MLSFVEGQHWKSNFKSLFSVLAPDYSSHDFEKSQKGATFVCEAACLHEQSSHRIAQVPRLQIKRTGLKTDYQEILSVYVSY